MKIGHFDARPAGGAATTADRRLAAQDATAGKVETEGEAVSTRVNLSGPSDGMPDASFDTAKVERIAQAIRDGTFRIDAGAIADKMLANAQELLAPAQD